MPSTVVHVAFGALLGAAFLGAAYDRRALLVVLGAAALPDLDAFGVVVFAGAHRTLLHTVLLPLAVATVVAVDLRVREESWLRARFGARGVRVTGVALVALAVAGIGLDFVTNGVNAAYPLVDRFYVLDGKLEFSTTEGLVQTFVEVPEPTGTSPNGTNATNATDGPAIPAPESVGTTENVTYSTGVNPDADAEIESTAVERVFPVVRSGWQLLVVVAGTVTATARFRVGGSLE